MKESLLKDVMQTVEAMKEDGRLEATSAHAATRPVVAAYPDQQTTSLGEYVVKVSSSTGTMVWW